MKTKGARQVRDRLDELLAAIREKVIEGRRRAEKTSPVAVFNPHASQEQWEKEKILHDDLMRLIETLDLFIHKEVEPFMERANPTVDARLTELDSMVAELQAKIRAIEQRDPPQQRLRSVK